jgi:hypothetical protein
VRADLREPPLEERRVAVVQLAGDRELEHAVAEELQPLVRVGAVRSPGGVGEDVVEPVVGQPVDEPPEVFTGAR